MTTFNYRVIAMLNRLIKWWNSLSENDVIVAFMVSGTVALCAITFAWAWIEYTF